MTWSSFGMKWLYAFLVLLTIPVFFLHLHLIYGLILFGMGAGVLGASLRTGKSKVLVVLIAFFAAMLVAEIIALILYAYRT